jgi:hypothetical protein
MGSRIGFITLIILAIAAGSCLRKKSIQGPEFIDRKDLVNILVDIHLSEGVANDRKFHRRFEADSIDMLTPILIKYGTTREQLDTTMYMYTRYPNLMDELYNEVLIKLNVMLDRNDKEEQPEEINKPAG